MKIGCIHLNLSSEGGDPRMFFLIAQNLKKIGHDVCVFTAQLSEDCFPELQKNLFIDVVPPAHKLESVFNSTSVFSKIRERILRERLNTDAARRIGKILPNDLDVLICHNDQSYKLGISYKKRNPAVKIVWIMNNAPFRHTRKENPIIDILSKWAAWFERFRVAYHLKGIDAVIVHDTEQKDLFKKIGGEAHILPIPINFENFYMPVKGRDFKRNTPVTLLGIGSLSPARSFEDIITSVSLLKKKGYTIRAEIICKDFWNNINYKKSLLNLVNRENVGDAIHFYFDGVSEEQLHDILSKSDVFIFPNHIRIWGMAAFEAMAAGLPLVVSSSTSVAEVLIDGTHALFSAPGDIEKISSNIELLTSNPALYLKIAENGQKFVRENLSWENYIRDLLSIIY